MRCDADRCADYGHRSVFIRVAHVSGHTTSTHAGRASGSRDRCTDALHRALLASESVLGWYGATLAPFGGVIEDVTGMPGLAEMAPDADVPEKVPGPNAADFASDPAFRRQRSDLQVPDKQMRSDPMVSTDEDAAAPASPRSAPILPGRVL